MHPLELSRRELIAGCVFAITGCLVESSTVLSTPEENVPYFVEIFTPTIKRRYTPENTPENTPEADEISPYGTYEILVAYEKYGLDPEDFTYEEIIKDAILFWNSLERLSFSLDVPWISPYPFLLKYTDEKANAQVVISFQRDVSSCGVSGIGDIAGCSTVVSAGIEYEFPIEGIVSDRFAKEGTFLIVEHEIGHAIGLRHSGEKDNGDQFRGASSELSGIMEPIHNPPIMRKGSWSENYNWDITKFNVYIDYGDFYKDTHQNIKRQVEYALKYWELDPHRYLSENVSFELSSNPNSEIIVKFADAAGSCSEEDFFCVWTRGNDIDGNGRDDHYWQLEIQIPNKEVDYFSWLVGYAIALTFRSDSSAKSDLPLPFRKPYMHDNWVSWWKPFQGGHGPID